MHVRTLVLPVAGLGKRLRPLTLTTPKNLVALNGKPLIGYALEEAKIAGIEEVVIVVSPEHKAKYEGYLIAAREQFPEFTFHLRVQEEPLGDGHAVLQAEDVVGRDPFAVRFCDDVIVDKEPTFARLVKHFNAKGESVIFLERVPQEDVVRYGVVKADPVPGEDRLYRIHGVVEKPKLEDAPSNLIVIGGYVLAPRVMEKLKQMKATMKHEADALRIAHALESEIADGGIVYGWEFPGKRLDCGTLDGLRFAENYITTEKLKTLKVE